MNCHKCGRGQNEGVGWIVRSKHQDGSGRYGNHEQCPEKVCKKRVNRGVGRWPDLQPCSRDAVAQADGDWLCKIHLNAWKKRKESAERFDRSWDASKANAERARLASEILEELGIRAGLHYHMSFRGKGSGHTGYVVIDPAELFRALGINVELPPIDKDWSK